MSDIRQAHHRLLEVLRREFRREDEEVREDHHPPRPSSAETVGPEIDDLPLGVPPEPVEEDEIELPGFPRGDSTHG